MTMDKHAAPGARQGDAMRTDATQVTRSNAEFDPGFQGRYTIRCTGADGLAKWHEEVENLVSGGAFAGGDRTVANGDTLNVTITNSATAT